MQGELVGGATERGAGVRQSVLRKHLEYPLKGFIIALQVGLVAYPAGFFLLVVVVVINCITRAVCRRHSCCCCCCLAWSNLLIEVILIFLFSLLCVPARQSVQHIFICVSVC